MLKSVPKPFARAVGAFVISAVCAFPIADWAHAQQPAQPPPRLQAMPVDQGLLDRWLIVFADVGPQLSSAPDLPEDKVNAIFDRACKKAQLNDIGQCHALDDYMGALISAVSEDGTKFLDPVARARQDLAQMLADPKVPARQKAEQKAEIEGFLSTMPERIPPEHIALLNRNARRIFAVLEKIQGPAGAQQGQPPAPQPGPAPKR